MKTQAITTISEDLQREFFEFDVKIMDSKFGKFAKWENHKHPENSNFMQTVNWVAYENGDKSKIIVRFSLDKTYNTMHDVEVLDHTGDFNEIVFKYWNSQSK